jgi:hypothetical protein
MSSHHLLHSSPKFPRRNLIDQKKKTARACRTGSIRRNENSLSPALKQPLGHPGGLFEEIEMTMTSA